MTQHQNQITIDFLIEHLCDQESDTITNYCNDNCDDNDDNILSLELNTPQPSLKSLLKEELVLKLYTYYEKTNNKKTKTSLRAKSKESLIDEIIKNKIT
jgi:hypothetical protein